MNFDCFNEIWNEIKQNIFVSSEFLKIYAFIFIDCPRFVLLKDVL